MGDVIVFAGGLFHSDREYLYSLGVRAIFGPGYKTVSIIEFLDTISERKTVNWMW